MWEEEKTDRKKEDGDGWRPSGAAFFMAPA